MRRNSVLTFLKEKSFIIVLSLMLLSAGTMAALFAFGKVSGNEGNEVAKQETIEAEIPVEKSAQLQEEVTAEQAQLPENTIETKEKAQENISENTEAAELEDQYLEAEEVAQVSGADVIAEGFSEASILSLQWPVEGTVILPFSMDRSVYFKTLAQYQYNPAMLIAAEEGTAVAACAAGTVTEVGKSNEYGHYVTMDLGDGFLITYGQLFEITAEVGESLDAGEQFAMVAYPTRSFLEEGDNLYLKLTQNEVPVDPAMYLE